MHKIGAFSVVSWNHQLHRHGLKENNDICDCICATWFLNPITWSHKMKWINMEELIIFLCSTYNKSCQLNTRNLYINMKRTKDLMQLLCCMEAGLPVPSIKPASMSLSNLSIFPVTGSKYLHSAALNYNGTTVSQVWCRVYAPSRVANGDTNHFPRMKNSVYRNKV